MEPPAVHYDGLTHLKVYTRGNIFVCRPEIKEVKTDAAICLTSAQGSGSCNAYTVYITQAINKTVRRSARRAPVDQN